MERAYSLLTITKADEERREISGIMSTGETDRVGDQVMPMGVKARLPAPCLWQHDHGDPIGEIVWIDPKPDGIRFRAKLAKIDSPQSLKEKLDGYFALIRAGVVKGVSIGFRALEAEPIATGLRFKSWELLEASVVTVPANASCTIQTVKALAKRASTCRVVRLDKPVTTRKAPRVVRLDGRELSSRAVERPISNAILEAVEESEAERKAAVDRLKLGAGGLTIAAVTAGAKATDAELAALRARLDRLERK